MQRRATLPSLSIAAAAVLALSLDSCATTGPAPAAHEAAAAGDYAACGRFFDSLQSAVTEAGVYDAQTHPVPGYPYLRVDRFLASFRHQPLDGGMRSQWVDRMQALSAAAWHAEVINLPAERRASLMAASPGERPLVQAVPHCAAVMRPVDLAGDQGFERLRSRVWVPDEYHTMWRVLGLYPLTGLFVSSGVSRLHHDTREVFSQPLDRLPVLGRLLRYVPPPGESMTPPQVAGMLARASDNPLRIPEPDAAQRDRLFNAFAPVWEVDTAGRDDRIGTPRWGGDGRIHVDTGRPVVYRLLSHSWWAGHPVLQLNYIIWFPARPAQGAVDPYAGRMDGITLRVTLGRDGRPLFYDSVHNCGCYHKFFPRRDIGVKNADGGLYEEPPLVPQSPPDLRAGQRLVLRVAHRTHYLQRLYEDGSAPPGEPYTFDDYNTLRALPLPDGGHRSLFDQHGLVPDTQRLERWWLWPMGVPSAGAMRQWGHHAIAFLGRRQFDDAHLFMSLFVASPP